ncbi:hypothetical protein GIB67_021451 [Kingdonia uniflora]|uniref:PTC1-like winged helix-turn-helix domain-containing protein n=1 Tax=Kingdonia uniflora TaxID=39325 RepID=A0A7J7NR99_9MAGN|nr:hypothetical protein GIB67_021451 [Kingdonia uniflora]
MEEKVKTSSPSSTTSSSSPSIHKELLLLGSNPGEEASLEASDEEDVKIGDDDDDDDVSSSPPRNQSVSYERAETKLYEIMKEKGAPMLRENLRNEARKDIGDTGLLDHLLKDMPGKLTPDGKARFQRRKNKGGLMSIG